MATEERIVRITHARVSYPHLLKPYQEGGRYSCQFLLSDSENADTIKSVKAMIQTVAKDRWKKPLQNVLPLGQNCCLKETDEEDYDYALAAYCDAPPKVVGRSREEFDAAKIVAGMICNASVQIWAQDNNYGRRINAGLRAVQYVGDDGTRFGGRTNVDTDSEFDILDEDEFAGVDELM